MIASQTGPSRISASAIHSNGCPSSVPADVGAASKACSRSCRESSGLPAPATSSDSISSASHWSGSPKIIGDRFPANTSARSLSQRMASRYICTIASVEASRSPATSSCVCARSHWPVTASSWNRKTRRFAAEGFWRICSCNRSSAVVRSPSRTAVSAAWRDMTPTALRQPGVSVSFEHVGAAALGASRILWGVADTHFLIAEGDPLDQLVSLRRRLQRGQTSGLELDLEVRERLLPRLTNGETDLLDLGMVPKQAHQRRGALVDALDDVKLRQRPFPLGQTGGRGHRGLHAPGP